MKLKALVVDDDPENLRIAGDILESLDHDCHKAADQEAARKFLAAGKYDYVLLDLEIPVRPGRLCRIENGKNLLQQIRQTKGMENVPILVITGHGQNSYELATEVFKLGATDYVVKPIDRGNLDRAIQAALAKVGKIPGPPASEAPKKLTPFKAAKREMLIHEDRVTVCGVEVWKDCAQPDLRAALLLLSKQDKDGFIRMRGAELDRKLGRDGSNPISSRFKGFRDHASEALKEAGHECGPQDILASGAGGYHFTRWMTVRVAGEKAQEKPARAEGEPSREPDEPEAAPTGETLNPRQEKILERLGKGEKLQRKDIVRQMGVNRSTVNRDLSGLRKAGRIRLHEDGYYVLVEPRKRAVDTAPSRSRGR